MMINERPFLGGLSRSANVCFCPKADVSFLANLSLCWEAELNMSEIYYVNTMLGKNNRSGSLAGKQPDFQKIVNAMRHSDNARYKDMKYVWSSGGRKLGPDEVTKVHYLDAPLMHDMPDIFKIRNAVLVVSKRLKDLIEEMDSGLHQFLPIKIVRSNKKEISELFFILNVLPEKSTLLHEQPAWYSGSVRRNAIDTMMASIEPYIVHASGQDGIHLWRDEHQPRLYFISKAFRERLQIEKIDFFLTYETAHEEGRS